MQTNTWIVKCPKHQEVCQYVQEQSVSSPFKCLQCDDLSFENPQQLCAMDEWVQRKSNEISEGLKYYRNVIDTIGRPMWNQIITLCRTQENVYDQAVMNKLRICDEIRQLKERIVQRLDQFQQQMETKLDEQINQIVDNIKKCQEFIGEYDIYQNLYPYQNPNNIYISIQQSANEVYKRISLMKQDTRLQVSNFRLAASKLCESSILSYKRDNDLDQRLMDEISKAYALPMISSNNVNIVPPHVRQVSQPISPFQKENTYFSQQENAQTPLSSNRLVTKQHSGPSSYSPKKLSPSPLRGKIEHTSTFLTTQGNKSLLLNQLARAPRATDISVKPLKKYQIDFSCAAVEVISDTVFALTSANDPYLRIFDTMMKRIHSLQSHQNPIIQIDKSHQPVLNNLALKQHVNGVSPSQRTWSSQKYILTLSIDSFVVWVYENQTGQQSSVPQIFLKIKCPEGVRRMCYLQDGNYVAFGDSQGNITVYNFQNQKFLTPQLERQHTKGVSQMNFITKTKKLVVLGEDEKISIWKIQYCCYPRQQFIESVKMEQSLLNLNIGTVKVIQPMYTEPEILILGNEEGIQKYFIKLQKGILKIINLQSEKIEIETSNQQYQSSVVDLNLAEESNTNENETSVCIIALSSQMKCLRLWRAQRQGKLWSQSESRVEIAMQLGENISRSKMQFVQLYNSNYYILIANENSKELLVYEVTTKQ